MTEEEQNLLSVFVRIGQAAERQEALSAGWRLLQRLLSEGRLTEAAEVIDALLARGELSAQKRAKCLATRANISASFGDVRSALQELDEALALTPTDERMLSNRALWQSASIETPEEACALMRKWAEALRDVNATTSVQTEQVHGARRPDVASDAQRIRVGYVSGDFRNHAARHFIEPILRHHDRERFEIHAFMTLAEDVLTANFKSWVDKWHDASAWTDSELFDAVKEQHIDVLVDLSGHTEGARLGVFARRAAPVQVTWFGYMATLGLDEIDWRFTDSVLAPKGAEAWYTERLWRLPSVYAYQPPAVRVKPHPEPPKCRNGYATMVCLNHSRKISDRSLALWCRLLNDNPNSGLILISAEKSEAYAPASLEARLRGAGIPPDQVSVVPRLTTEAFMSLASVADFALDTFPVSGGTTTLLAMSMGLPVLALDRKGAAPLETLSARLLTQASLRACVATDETDYLTKAKAWLSSDNLLRDLRESLPTRVASAPFMQHAEITREVERAYRTLLHHSLSGDATTAVQGDFISTT
jgi:predicted O-linked N-acetylglucosamine transferase (SPINDLY family)